MVQELTAETFQKEVLESALPIIVDFWAAWCGPCRMLAPVFEELSKEYAGKLTFAKISVDDYPAIAQEYDVSGIPCLIVFSRGKEAERIVGFQQKAQLQEKIDKAIR
ncbi:MAG: thioredoxin [Nanoarchaeota archaeon]|nr:thioredoxin [Nanoarchaeota archaeon]